MPLPLSLSLSPPRVLVLLALLCLSSLSSLPVCLSSVTSIADLLALHASRSLSVPSHRDISAVHTLDAYVVYDGTGGGSGSVMGEAASPSLSPLSHFHPLSHHSFRTLSAESGLPSYAHRASSTGVVSESGTYQPFPERVVLAFDAFQQHFTLPLHRVPSLWVHNASVSVRDGMDGEVASDAPLDSTYWALSGDYLDDDWAVATLREDGRFHAVIQHEGEVYQADPIEHFQPHMDAQHFHTLATASERGMAVYRHRDIHNQHDKQCGADGQRHAVKRGGEDTQAEAEAAAAVVEQDMAQAGITMAMDAASTTYGSNSLGNISSSRSPTSTSASPSSRQLLQLRVGDEWPTAPNLSGMSIFTIFSTPQRMPYSFVVDAGFYSLFNSVADVQAAVTAVLVASNIVLLKQAQLYIQINSITVMTQPNPSNGPNPWNQAAYPAGTHACPNYDIETQLNDMNSYRQNYHPNQGAAHHLFTNCWPAPGTVGISYIGWTCTADYAISVSSYNAPFWQTVVHEIGHTLGAEHTFATPTWAGGGIMDYYVDSRYPIGTGPYQFAPPNEAQMQFWVAHGLPAA